MTESFPYGSPAALRAALTDRLKKLARASAFTVTDLQRQFAYDRLLSRVFSAPDADRWVLKGAAALLARLEVARHSKDIDLSWQSAADLDEAEQALRAAAGRNLGDFFVFEIGPPTPLVGDKGRRFAVVAGLGGRPFASFSVDLVAGHSMTHPPEVVSPLVSVEIPGLARVNYRAYPLVDHIADKVTACLETHARSDGAVSVSSRYKDLVDLVLIARTQQPVAADLRRALLSETARRGVGLPTDFMVPGSLWPAGYETKAAELSPIFEN
ncbi:nucleotidyl transferase AbiEii/AbiGii toxin family protein [Dactylosporangium sp. NPDC050588]|uniref:nucleotidyl transferase AbiEii/AbiGii toxin family protein n=1 Tax=Dactylosporangium sp. NPDC050588 TaxID=3157211 RepID=UPI0033C1C76F